MRRWLYFLLTIGVAALLVVGLIQASGSKPEADKAPPFDLEAALTELEGAPKPLAGLHAQASMLLPDDVDAFKARLKSLRGYPVVVNKWGSWCGPCRAEFPVFQRVGTDLGKKVAFLGINGADPEDGAKAFLEDFPVTYPSYRDPSGTQMAKALDVSATYYPATIFVDESGKTVIAKQGEYVNADQLRADIKKYLGV